MTPDPIGLEGGINLFAYVENNPVNADDPLGLQGVVAPVPVPLPLPPVFIPGTPENQSFVDSTSWAIEKIKDAISGSDTSEPSDTQKDKCKECEPCTPYPTGTIGYIGPH